MPPFQRIQQKTMADGVVEALRHTILSGAVAPGEQLRETLLSTDLGISRGPLREALQRLEEEGLVVRVPFRGAYVAEVSAEVADEIERLRRVLEPYAIETGLDDLRSGPAHDELVAAVAALDEHTAAGDIAASIDTHLAVHRAIYRASGNGVLFGIWESWEKQLRLFLAVDHRAYAELAEIGHSHRTLLACIEAGDRRAILRELAVHIHPAIEPAG